MALSSLASTSGRPAPAPSRRPRRVACRSQASTGLVKSTSDQMELGKTGIKVPVVGVGAWAWGDRSGYWVKPGTDNKADSRSAFDALVRSGLTFVDTAEVYGFGQSEEFLGEFIRTSGNDVQIATKFPPLPWRLTADSLVDACKASLQRLQQPKVTLYQQHWPGFFFNTWSNDAYLEGLIRVKQQGMADAVGVSNFSGQRTRDACKRLGKDGVLLASNQVQYSLVYRAPEKNGMMEAAREQGVTIIAYSPLCQGLLTGKYMVGGERPYGARGSILSEQRIREVQPVLEALKAVADERGKTMAQVALNWCVCKGAQPIPGAKNARQLEDIAGAVGWRLSDGEVAELDKASDRVPAGLGAPYESW